MTTLYLGTKALTLTPNMVVGQGGEAVIYRLPGNEVLKVYMQPNDPAFLGKPEAQAVATARLREQQSKLLAFPRGLPSQVVAPSQLAYDRQTGGQIAGFSMPFLKDMEVLLSYGDRKFRESRGIDANQVVELFRNLHGVVTSLHKARVVIGDFNDLNVLVDANLQAHLVDADSMQFGPYQCRTFTTRFVDPLHCETSGLLLNSPHDETSDWYAFVTMLFQCLLYINPYFGGVHRPKNGVALRNDARVLHRLSVFSSDVVYPKVALPLTSLPDDLLAYFTDVYDHDMRGVVPESLLANLRWTSCSSCGLLHARNICPACSAPGVVKQTVTIRGTVKATTLFRTSGRILQAASQNGMLNWVYHESGAYYRENGAAILQGDLDGGLRVRIKGDATVLAKGNTMVTLGSDGSQTFTETGTVGRLPIFDTNAMHMYWLEQNRLVRDGRFGPVDIGTILPDQTLVWVGSRFGFGFYRAGAITRGMVFDVEKSGLNDSVPLPAITGNLIDATCVFSDSLAWFMVSVQNEGVIRNHCYVINNVAGLVASAESVQGDGAWLGDGIRGRMAMGQSLYVATDTGIVRVGISGASLAVDSEFPDTEPFVDSLTVLHPGKGGICAMSPKTIVQLEIR